LIIQTPPRGFTRLSVERALANLDLEAALGTVDGRRRVRVRVGVVVMVLLGGPDLDRSISSRVGWGRRMRVVGVAMSREVPSLDSGLSAVDGRRVRVARMRVAIAWEIPLLQLSVGFGTVDRRRRRRRVRVARVVMLAVETLICEGGTHGDRGEAKEAGKDGESNSDHCE
jgi:hypothetical protein